MKKLFFLCLLSNSFLLRADAYKEFKKCFAKNDEAAVYNAVLIRSELETLEALIEKEQLPEDIVLQESESILSNIKKILEDNACSVECQYEFENIHKHLFIFQLLTPSPLYKEFVEKTNIYKNMRNPMNEAEKCLSYGRAKLLSKVRRYKKLLPSTEQTNT